MTNSKECSRNKVNANVICGVCSRESDGSKVLQFFYFVCLIWVIMAVTFIVWLANDRGMFAEEIAVDNANRSACEHLGGTYYTGGSVLSSWCVFNATQTQEWYDQEELIAVKV